MLLSVCICVCVVSCVAVDNSGVQFDLKQGNEHHVFKIKYPLKVRLKRSCAFVQLRIVILH